MSKIKKIYAREILDSRGNPTVEVGIRLDSGVCARAAVPSGASTGSKEAIELRDQNSKRFLGKGVLQAVKNVNEVIQPALIGANPNEQEKLDKLMCELDGTANKSRLGANAILGVSLALANVSAQDSGVPLYQYLGDEGPFTMPVPMMNIINGGVHADNNLDVQEFMILPVGAPTFAEALRYGAEVFHCLKKRLSQSGFSISIGDEGGFAPDLKTNEAAMELILEAIKDAGYYPGQDIYLGLDIASNEIMNQDRYFLRSENLTLTSEQLIKKYEQWIERYPILSIEDGLGENDWEGWKQLTHSLGHKVQLVGDDLFVTHEKLLKEGIKNQIANSILIKLNQVGTLTETLRTMGLARQAGYTTVVSHRSGETEDTFIADLAVATAANQIKTGSLCRSERVAKYNRLLRIEEKLGTRNAPYLGLSAFPLQVNQV